MWCTANDSPPPPPLSQSQKTPFVEDVWISEDSTDSVSRIVAAVLRQCRDDDDDEDDNDNNNDLFEQLFGPASSGLWPYWSWPPISDAPLRSSTAKTAKACTEATKTAEDRRKKLSQLERWPEQNRLSEPVDVVVASSAVSIKGIYRDRALFR